MSSLNAGKRPATGDTEPGPTGPLDSGDASTRKLRLNHKRPSQLVRFFLLEFRYLAYHSKAGEKHDEATAKGLFPEATAEQKCSIESNLTFLAHQNEAPEKGDKTPANKPSLSYHPAVSEATVDEKNLIVSSARSSRRKLFWREPEAFPRLQKNLDRAPTPPQPRLQSLQGLTLYWLPGDHKYPLSLNLPDRAKAHGAVNFQARKGDMTKPRPTWNKAITHLVVETAIDYPAVVDWLRDYGEFDFSTIPSGAVFVNPHWPTHAALLPSLPLPELLQYRVKQHLQALYNLPSFYLLDMNFIGNEFAQTQKTLLEHFKYSVTILDEARVLFANPGEMSVSYHLRNRRREILEGPVEEAENQVQVLDLNWFRRIAMGEEIPWERLVMITGRLRVRKGISETVQSEDRSLDHTIRDLLLKHEYEYEASNLAPGSLPFHVEYWNQDVMVVRHPHPASRVHMLLIPVSPPGGVATLRVLQDPVFLSLLWTEAEKLRAYVGRTMEHRGGSSSPWDRHNFRYRDERGREDAIETGQEWEKDVMVGVHAQSSPGHLLVHVLSVDRCPTNVRSVGQYNSFATPFFIDLADFPLADTDVRGRDKYLDADLKCWRCGAGFGQDFDRFKAHLEDEFEEEEE
jgi:aprataxin